MRLFLLAKGTPLTRCRWGSLAAVAAAAAAGCSTLYPVRVQSMDAAAGESRNWEQVEVYSSEPARSYVQIARLSTESVNYDNPGHAVARLRVVAAERGADAIILEKRGRRAASASLPISSVDRDFGFGPPIGGPSETASGGYAYSSYAEAVAIRWTDADPEEKFIKIQPADMSNIKIKGSASEPSPASRPLSR